MAGGKLGGAALRTLQTLLYAIAFGCGAVILGIFSYFLSVLADRHRHIPTWEKAVEGMAGAAVLYTLFAVLLTCFLGGKTIFALLGILLDLLFMGAFIAMAILTRDGAHKCHGSQSLNTPLGSGQANQGGNGFNSSNVTYQADYGLACRLNKAAFIVSIIGAFIFFLAALVQFLLNRHHKREKAFGPSPTNGYTAGTAGNRKFWQRKPKTTHNAYAKDAEAGLAVPAATTGVIAADRHHHNNTHDVRPSHDTTYTDRTAVAGGAHPTYSGNKYDPNGPAGIEHAAVIPDQRGSHAVAPGYHTAPTGTAVNPYGYENGRTAATNY